jgi:flagellar export protein FliJ
MPSFHFSLDRVLRWRSVELAREQARLERLIQEQIRLQQLAASLGDERSKLEISVATLPDLRGQDLRAITGYGIRLRRQAQKLAQLSAKCERELAAQKTRYNEAKQRFRLLEELRSRKLTRWQYEQGQELEALAAESYLATWSRERA